MSLLMGIVAGYLTLVLVLGTAGAGVTAFRQWTDVERPVEKPTPEELREAQDVALRELDRTIDPSRRV